MLQHRIFKFTDEPNDIDVMKCDERFPVIEDISKTERNWFSLLIVRESDTPDGYVKLQLVLGTQPCVSNHLHLLVLRSIGMLKYLKIDKLGRIVLFDFFIGAI